MQKVTKQGNNLKKKIFVDFILNIIATALPIALLQLIIYPKMAIVMGSEGYGLALTLLGIVNIVSIVLGNSLNNVRIILNKQYDERQLEGDFNVILIAMALINIVAMVVSTAFFKEGFSFITITLVVIYSLLQMVQLYITVAYRLKLNFKHILLNNICLTAGYFIGFIFFRMIDAWQIIFIVGMVASLAYEIFTTKLLLEPRKITPLFKTAFNKTLLLVFTTLMANILLYLDRLLLYPLLGGTAVSIYYTASLFGKLLGMVIAPVAVVLLSYYAKKSQMRVATFWKINFASLAMCVLFFIFSIFAAIPITRILYPSFIEQAIPYIHIANLATIVGVAGLLAQQALLRFCNTGWQLFIQGVYMVSYFLGGYILLKQYGLMGFCYAALISSSLKLIVTYLIGSNSLKKQNSVIKDTDN